MITWSKNEKSRVHPGLDMGWGRSTGYNWVDIGVTDYLARQSISPDCTDCDCFSRIGISLKLRLLRVSSHFHPCPQLTSIPPFSTAANVHVKAALLVLQTFQRVRSLENRILNPTVPLFFPHLFPDVFRPSAPPNTLTRPPYPSIGADV